jgi:hypothetical protein
MIINFWKLFSVIVLVFIGALLALIFAKMYNSEAMKPKMEPVSYRYMTICIIISLLLLITLSAAIPLSLEERA